MIELKQSKTGGIAVCLFLYIPVVWVALLIAQSLGGGLPDIIEKLTAALENPFKVHWTEYSALSILFCTAAYILALLYRSANQGRTREGEEHGSAAWASPHEVNAQFSQKENKLLTRNVRLGLDTHKHRRSLNVLVIGGSGAGKAQYGKDSTFPSLLRSVRLEYAKGLLSSTKLPIYDVAEEAGFNSLHTFIRLFKREIGMTPTQFREVIQDEQVEKI